MTRSYDGLGRQYLTNTNGILVNSTFDAYGRAVTQSTPHTSGETSYNTVTTFDALGRPDLVTAPDGTQVDYTYNGFETKVKDANNHETTTLTNILGRTLSVTPPTGPAVSFTYDASGNMLTASRGGATVTLAYDTAGRKLSMNDPDMGNWSYAYDALGSMTSQTDARGCVTNLDYDLLGRPLSKTFSNCPSTSPVAYGYDSGTNGIGRRTSMTDGSGSSSWNYDSRGRLTKETKTISGSSFITEWGYNSADLPTWMKYPDGEIVTSTYDSHMSLDAVVGNETYVYDTQYDSAGRMTSRELGNGISQTYEYYPWNQQGGHLKILAAETLQNMTYVYGSTGNITTITDSINSLTQSFGYDALDRLTSATASGTPGQGAYSETYEYDPVTGNLKIKGNTTLDYLDSNHVHAVTNANSNTYSYDSNGNQITRNIGSDTFNLYYDAENRLVEVKKNSVAIAQFTFDGDGRRVKSVMDGETILFVGSHFEQKGSQATKYYFAGASRIAIRKYTVPQSMTVEYMLGDHLGSTSITTDNLGVMISEMRYKAWGETRYSWTNAPVTTPAYELTKYQYTGQYSYDAEFGLRFYGARFYDGVLGRFVSPDSIIPPGAQGYDRYAYTSNNPLNNIDPTGHTDIPWWQVIKYLGGQLIANGAITNSDWETAANAYIPATHKASNASVVAGAVASPGAAAVEINTVSTRSGDVEVFLSLGGGGGIGAGVAVGATQGVIDGSGFTNAKDFGGTAAQVSVGGNLPAIPIGITADAWGGSENGESNHVYGLDWGGTIGTPGVSFAGTAQLAIPLFGFELDGFGLFVCRVAGQCGSPLPGIDLTLTDQCVTDECVDDENTSQ